ncbi:SlyX family protein [Roseibium sediminis]|uniref:SlyX family protein n=1 Tax=Roseibium sediminis TaxID=1775174 RepID=UPI00123CF89A|nr:SlyX family protein [Roseibium sediminis]
MSTSVEERLDTLEIELAHANHTIDELNAVVVDQGRQIDRLTRKLIQMTNQIEDLIENSVSAPPIQKPPHY